MSVSLGARCPQFVRVPERFLRAGHVLRVVLSATLIRRGYPRRSKIRHARFARQAHHRSDRGTHRKVANEGRPSRSCLSGEMNDAAAAACKAVALEPLEWRHPLRLSYASWGEDRLRVAHRLLATAPARLAGHPAHGRVRHHRACRSSVPAAAPPDRTEAARHDPAATSGQA